VVNWFASYLSGRTQYVRSSVTTSSPSAVVYGIPQGSVLFLLYVADLLKLVKRHQLHPHGYADDTQIYGFCRPSEVDDLSRRVSGCIDEVSVWMKANRLQLNPAKIEVLWCSSPHHQHQIPTSQCESAAHLSCRCPQPGILASTLTRVFTMKTHVTAVARSCFAALWHIRSIWRSLLQHTLLTPICALMISKINYCCSILAGISGHLLSRLQLVLNGAARNRNI